MLTIRRGAGDPSRTNRLLKIAGPLATNVVPLQHDVCVYLARLEAGAEVIHRFSPDRGAYVYVLDGAASLDRDDLSTGDAAKAVNQAELTIRAWQTTELILVDFPMTAEPSTAFA